MGNEPCCSSDNLGSASNTEGKVSSSTVQASIQAFGSLMSSSAKDGKIGARSKELITYALIVLARCEPCMRIHLEKAKSMGISQEELDEAAWCAIAMGGAPVKMFYNDYFERAKKE